MNLLRWIQARQGHIICLHTEARRSGCIQVSARLEQVNGTALRAHLDEQDVLKGTRIEYLHTAR